MEAARKAIDNKLAEAKTRFAKAAEEAERACARLEVLARIIQHTSEPPYAVNPDKLEAYWMKTPDYSGVRLWASCNTWWNVTCQARVGSWKYNEISFDAEPLEVAKLVNQEMALYRNYKAWEAAHQTVYRALPFDIFDLRRSRFGRLSDALESVGVPCPDTRIVRVCTDSGYT
jgi:hypothetical protein